MNYIVHDFEAMCHQLKPHTRRVLIDMGASLEFHNNRRKVPIVQLLELYEKFGFYFDHIYGFEITPTDANKVYGEMLPEKYFPSYHWINTGVSEKQESKLNPLHSILKYFNHDDLVVVKLDIDTPEIEVPLAYQILNDESLHGIIDHFYFEHHVSLLELRANWHAGSRKETLQDTFTLMNGIRRKGVAAHFWV